MKGNELHLHLHVLVFIYPKAVSVFLLYDNCVRVFFSPSLSLSLSLCLCVRRDCPQPSREDAPRNIAMQAEWPNGQPEKGGSPLAALAIYLSYPFMCAFFSLSLLLCLYCLQPDSCLIIFFTTLLRFCYMMYFFIYHGGLAVLAVEPLNCRHGRGKDLRPLMLMAPHARGIPIGNDSN